MKVNALEDVMNILLVRSPESLMAKYRKLELVNPKPRTLTGVFERENLRRVRKMS